MLSEEIVCFVRYLLQNGACLSAVNCDGEVPLDLAIDETTESLLQDYSQKMGEGSSGCHMVCVEDGVGV